MADDRPGQPAAAPPGGDPSMEDILASIRRILNEDEPGAAAATEPPAETSDALALTEEMLVPDEAAGPSPAGPPPPQAVPDASPPVVPAPPLALQSPAAEDLDALLAPAASAAASASIGNLFRAVAQDRGAGVYRGGPSIEDVVREEMRPLLKEWLDRYLPEMVERLVRAEIDRVTGRGPGGG
ncbi:MAG: hypothetical protein JWP04_3985 [Belnapia sp.]|jgi:cell pole-organizing protein PopZ|nr:hypothetical protein [Belnapia sp.]